MKPAAVGAGVSFDDCLAADRGRLIGLSRALGRASGAKRDKLQADLEALLSRSRAAVAARRAALPRPEFPEDLPVNQRRAEIAAAIRDHQVIIVCGETGSGKTTQLPKICLELGRGAHGLIGHTQPRRIAARSTAARIAQELKSELGQAVGYKIRFTDRLSPSSAIKLMTDGILLAETQGDPWLSAYDTLIVDEAHERSLNIDFLLGYLRTLLPRRPDLKLIVTSATLDAERFARHFADGAGRPAPVIEVSGRLYPIEMRYRPVAEDEGGGKSDSNANAPGRRDAKKRDLYEALVDAVDEAQASGPGDVLVFLPGEREIREAAEALRHAHHAAGTEILPLFARQSAQEQARVFAGSKGRRVVLATNVAETSLTVPGIRYVVDTGLARVKRYSYRNKVEQLQVEKVAQSAARQRAGRCGRVMDGICFRLYGEDDFERRPAHTDPEILRSSLAGVILRMKALGLGAVEDFPFIDPPSPRMIGDGYQLLAELGAVTDDDARELTPVGRELAKLPLDPKVGRMILAARERACLGEMLVVAAALSVQDPRERPQDNPGAADQAHARFRGGEQDQRSEFLWYLHLWRAWNEVQRHETSSKQKAWCKKHYLSWLRLREWRDVYNQLHALCAEHGWHPEGEEGEGGGKPATAGKNTAGKAAAPAAEARPIAYEPLHKALLAGLLGHIGCRAEDASGPQAGSYLGARGIRFWPHPGSALARKAGKWIMAAELVDTTRLFARCLARIEPEWVEEVGAHLLRRHVFEPHWSKSAGSVRAWERGTVHGLVLYARRGVGYRDTDPALCRELFIREGLVQGEIAEGAARAMPFLRHNLKLVEEIERLEHKSRRPDVLVDEELIHAFYDAKLPAEVVDLPSFERWRKQAERAEPKLLHLAREQLMRHEAEGITTDRFPAHFEVLGQALKLAYLHAPGEADDGVTLTVPLAMLNQIPAARCEWLVPGLLEEKVAALLRTVPQKHRHRLQPIADSAAAFMALFEAGELDTDDALLRALQAFVEERVSLKLPLESFRAENLHLHCFMNFRVIDEHGRVLGQSRDLAELRARYREQIANRFRAARIDNVGAPAGAPPAGKKSQEAPTDAVAKPQAAAAKPAGVPGGLIAWTFGALPELLEIRVDGREVIGFPALHDDGDSVSLRPYDTPEEAARIHAGGLARLFALNLKDQVRAIEKLPGLRELALQMMPFCSDAELKSRLVAATLRRCCLQEPWPADAESFARRCAEAKPRITLVAQEFMRLAGQLAVEYAALQKRLSGLKTFPEAVADIQAQIAALLPRDFLLAHPWERLAQLPRYLKGASIRLDKLRNNPARDAQLLGEWQALARQWEREQIAKRRAGVEDPRLEEFRWLLEELRVGLFAQELKTPMPVSVKRLQKIWEARPR
ncbi:ATP-dependent RNA helicase HrpA [Pseudothauera nasutitermitis]|uniref:ATP-dependent RNA helicase HrpA n=1 Tax=Pseudothauera nasutitermitis TaxID=2565930 RepID=A0A4S4AM04_9RHOO|nr:ATP-dependent RNA helicase HrpA [Pseudothauera nasutitermitis]THF60586.1 ATP-dependent RNA helicase HrpA [Pseudothauera nasutitermitis]